MGSQVRGEWKVTHGMHKSREYQVWADMKTRCRNPRCRIYKHYGGRGISVCERWQKFENFYADMGPRPGPEYSLDRIDNDGNYEPGNCQWAVKSQQNSNKRTNTYVTYQGKEYTVCGLADKLGIPRSTLQKHIWNGLSAEDAVEQANYNRI